MSDKTTNFNKITKLCLPALFCCLLWGSAFPCIKIGYRLFDIDSNDTGSQLLFAGIRFFIAGLMVIAFESVRRKKVIMPSSHSFGKIALISLFQTVLQYLFFYVGLANTSGVKASVIVGSNVFIALIVSALIFRLEKFTINKAMGCIIGFIGVAVVNLSGSLLDGVNLKGDGFILISAVAYAMSTVLIKIFSKDEDPIAISGYQFALGGAVLGIMGFVMGGRINSADLPSVLIILYLAFISAAAYTVWSLLLKNNPVSSVAVYGFANPVFGVILSGLMLDEANQAFGLSGIIAVALVSIGIVTVNRAKDGVEQ